MKHLIFTFIIVFSLATGNSFAYAQGVRPIRDDVGYCWNIEQMQKLIDYLHISEQDPVTQNFIAGISPHDDYLYAARIYYPLFRSLKTKEAVIFGVTHGTVRKEIGDPQNIIILDEFTSWKGPRQNIPISPLREFIKARLDTSYFKVNNKAHQLEHSIEALLPFLQYFNPDIHITPIMVTAMPFERMDEISEKLSEIISDYLKKKELVPGRDIVFLISSDANHYGKDFNNIPFGEDDEAYRKGTANDILIANTYLTGAVKSQKVRELMEKLKNVVWCGKYSIPIGLLTAEKTIEKSFHKQLKGSILRYSDTYTEGVIPLKQTGLGTTAPFSLKHWVGFFSAGFYLQ
jgi:MEMO1 family protein